MSQINLSAGVRSNLLSLQGTANMLERTQNRLATGLKVNGPLDDAAAFFTAQGLNSRANDLSSITQGMQNGMKTIQAASKGLSAITKTMENMIGQVRQALQDPGAMEPGTATIDVFAQDTDAQSGTVTIDGTEFTVSVGAGDLNEVAAADRAQVMIDAIRSAEAGSPAVNLGELLDEMGATISFNGTNGLSISNGGSDAIVFGGTLFGSGATAAAAVETITDARQALMNSYNDLRDELNALARDSGYNGNNLLMGDVLEVVFNELTQDDRTSFTVSANRANGDAFGNVTAERLGGELGTVENFASNSDLEGLLEDLQGGVSELRSLSSQLGTAQTIIENRENFTKQMVNTLRSGADGLTLADMNEEAANNLALQTKQQLGQSALALAIQNDQSVLQLLR